ncbi:hypothetical protein [Nitriliruptor alkaliphilus]|uniref:hypothetical protein n=1 Tax=Nitriliruptor alkaliphilus TaxID=427918 RepID=UPI00069718F4|nr:hypothetical protein [Nitriliruptor alkaliphilus]
MNSGHGGAAARDGRATSNDDASRVDRRVRTIALVAFAATTCLAVAGPVLTLLAGEPLWPSTAATTAMYVFVVVGALIAFRRPRNPIGWLCLVVGAAFALEGALWAVAFYGFAHPGSVPLPEVWAVLGDAIVMPGGFLAATLLILLFPDGRLPSPGWRWLAWLTTVLLVINLLAGPFLPTAGGWGRPPIPNPMAVAAAEWVEPTVFGLFGCVIASVVALVRRLRRSRGIERLQLRWLAAAGVAAVLSWLIAILLSVLVGDDVAVVVAVAGFSLVPIAIGVAVARYRLFEIDRLISRTVTYAAVVAVLAAVYVAGVLVLGTLLPRQSDLGVAASTLAVAALFLPLRRRVQQAVERRFNRSRYDAERELERFAGRLRDELDLDLDSLTDDLLGVVATTVQPSRAGLWIRGPTS